MRDTAYMSSPGVAVFEPEGYESINHTPSPIFISELKNTGKVDKVWKLRPIFSRHFGKSTATLHTGNADKSPSVTYQRHYRHHKEHIVR